MSHMNELEKQGYTILPDYFDQSLLDRLIHDLDEWMDIAHSIRIKNGLGNVMAGVAHQILGRNDSMADLIKMLPWHDILQDFFDGPYILNSYSAVKHVSNNEQSYQHVRNFHRDVRTFSGDFKLMINVLVMLEDFTVANGATQVVPRSHMVEAKPSESSIEEQAKTLLGSAGTVVLFDSNLWHATSPNLDGSPRRTLTLNYSRPFMKQQADFCKLVGKGFSADPDVMQIIGFRSRVPESHSDWYQPIERRFYYADQG